MHAHHLDAVLHFLLPRCKRPFLKIKEKRSTDLGAYILGMWTAGKTKGAALDLPSTHQVELELGCEISDPELEAILEGLKREGIIRTLLVDDPQQGQAERLFVMPSGVLLSSELSTLGEASLTDEDLANLCSVSRKKCEEFSNDFAFANRVQGPVSGTGSILTSKMATFGLFLLLAGAVSEGTALVLKQRATKEYQHQDRIVEYIGYVGLRLYGNRYKKDKKFETGALQDDLERRGQLERTFGPLFVWKPNREADPPQEAFYFDVLGRPDESGVIFRAVSRLLRKIQKDQADAEEFADKITDLVRTFWFQSPIEYRRLLFADEAPDTYYGKLTEAVKRALQELDDAENGDDLEPEDSDFDG